MPARFHIEVGNYCKLPPRYQKPVREAAYQCLEALPKSVRAEKLKYPGPYTLNVAFVGESRMRQLNSTFRGKDRPTDVLSFSRLEGDGLAPPLFDVGDVIICPTVAKKNTTSKSFLNELRTLTVHGVLHLFGYDHETSEKDARRMFRLQEKVVNSL